MLRITKLHRDTDPVLKLEGQLLQPWVEEVILACTQGEYLLCPQRLDLSEVSYVDAAGLVLLRDLIRQGFGIVASSPFVAALLQTEKP
jgi:ABC-type transporter Mla MlaB component